MSIVAYIYSTTTFLMANIIKNLEQLIINLLKL